MSDSFALLEQINDPADLRTLSRSQLAQLAFELRAFMIDSVARSGGHLSSNLGTIELAIALHYVYDTPLDHLIWDVGHQSYAHKILTGRRQAMAGLRQHGGISGFPRRSESAYDVFGTAHSSTSISAALGLAIAARDQKQDVCSVAVIGDGALSAGMAFEALNHAGDTDGLNLLVILNDNEMSISPPVGALTNILARMLSGATWNAARRAGSKVLSVVPPAHSFARRIEEHVKGLIIPGTLFEEFGFSYYGPVDGHDLEALIPTLTNLRKLEGPQFLHVITRKGQGYAFAEADPVRYHGVSPFDPASGIADAPDGSAPAATYTSIFGDWLCDTAARDARLVAITPAMCEGSGMVRFAHEFADRYHDVGIAEQHALTLAAGMACAEIKPVVAIYSTFLQRGYDQFIHDIALQNLPVMLAVDRAGLVGADGATHHGAFDLSFLLCIPNVTVFCPANGEECRLMLDAAYACDGPSVVRYPRGAAASAPTPPPAVQIGQAHTLRNGQKIALAAFGSLCSAALEVGEKIDATVVNMRFAKPLDTDCLAALAQTHTLIVTLEENAVIGGAGGEAGRFLDSLPQRPRLLRLGLPDVFIDHGQSSARLLAEAGLDAAGIEAAIKDFLNKTNGGDS